LLAIFQLLLELAKPCLEKISEVLGLFWIKFWMNWKHYGLIIITRAFAKTNFAIYLTVIGCANDPFRSTRVLPL